MHLFNAASVGLPAALPLRAFVQRASRLRPRTRNMNEVFGAPTCPIIAIISGNVNMRKCFSDEFQIIYTVYNKLVPSDEISVVSTTDYTLFTQAASLLAADCLDK